ncbi:MAG TPA: zinc ABC transporter substrate-binding protein [Nitrosopumilaceae archaeon]|nr:zinc ABC transporter substrate-binding protein [Nitrosopumilaceae archaeon]
MNNDKKAAILAIFVVIPFTAFSLWLSEQNKAESMPVGGHKILVTFYPLYQFTKAVGKDKIDVSVIIPPGIEPHDWEPTIQDIEKMKDADMIVINGAGLESWITKITSVNPNVMIVDTSNDIQLLEKDSNGLDKTAKTDPHIWLDPVLAKKQVQNIANGLIKLDPQNVNYYQQNANNYNTKLDALNSKIKMDLSICSKKDFLAFHDAFSYFSKEYGLHQHTVVGGLDPETEPTAPALQQITKDAQSLGLNVIFTEEAANPRVSQVIADEIHGKVMVLSPLEVTDKNIDYVLKMEQNLSNLKEALCS